VPRHEEERGGGDEQAERGDEDVESERAPEDAGELQEEAGRYDEAGDYSSSDAALGAPIDLNELEAEASNSDIIEQDVYDAIRRWVMLYSIRTCACVHPDLPPLPLVLDTTDIGT
jgi:hypothetical protein